MSDWDLSGPGMDEDPAPVRRAGSRRQWTDDFNDVVDTATDTKRAKPVRKPGVYERLRAAWLTALEDWQMEVLDLRPPARVFEKHCRELLEKVTEEELVESFDAFAGDLTMGRVRLSETSPWFQYYGRRNKYLAPRTGAHSTESGDYYL